MPTHSPRPTAGRKPKADRPSTDDVPNMPPPRRLTKEERAIWKRLAPAAAAIGTLIPETVAGFTLLCQTLACRDAAKAALDSAGLVVDGAINPVAVHYRQLGQRAESLMAKYAIVAPGRAVERPKAPTTPSKWDVLRHAPETARQLEALSDAHRCGDATDEDLLHAIIRVQ